MIPESEKIQLPPDDEDGGDDESYFDADKYKAARQTPEEKCLTDWAHDAYRNSLKAVQDSLRAVVVLLTALLAGSAALFAQMPINIWFKGLATLALLTGLVIALLGSMPFRVAEVSLRRPREIQNMRERAETHKARLLRASCAALVIAFALFVAGVIIRGLWPE